MSTMNDDNVLLQNNLIVFEVGLISYFIWKKVF